jgi:hypothetical protein
MSGQGIEVRADPSVRKERGAQAVRRRRRGRPWGRLIASPSDTGNTPRVGLLVLVVQRLES